MEYVIILILLLIAVGVGYFIFNIKVKEIKKAEIPRQVAEILEKIGRASCRERV